MKNLIVARRFCGPPTTANGGYFSGKLAACAPQAPVLSVRLRSPPPLDTEMTVVDVPGGGVEVRHGERLVGSCGPAALDLTPIPPVEYAEAQQASLRYTKFAKHPFPTCFVCGVARAPGDGLRIYAGRVGSGAVVAAPWTPDASLDRGDGAVSPRFMWSALDCPGYSAVTPDERPMLLAQFTVQLYRPVRVDEPCIVMGWGIRSNSPKHEAGTALYGRDGELCGVALALWVEPKAR